MLSARQLQRALVFTYSTRCHSRSSISHASNRYHGVPIVYHEAYSAPQLPTGHRFPMGVFKRIYEVLLEDGIVTKEQVHRPEVFPSEETMSLVHTKGFLEDFLKGKLDLTAKKRIGFGDVVCTKDLIMRTLSEVAGTILTARLALDTGLACNTAGGTHHAFPSFGSGFCILNDAAITAKLLLQEGRVKKVVVLDLDVHQGDGTAVALRDEARAFTVSVHCASNFPSRKQSSDLDVGLPEGLTDSPYLSAVAETVTTVLQEQKPDLVLYDAGVDPHKDDSLGKLSLTDTGLLRRDLLVMDTCLSRGIAVAGYVGGGYSSDLDVLGRRHSLLHRAASEIWSDYRLSS